MPFNIATFKSKGLVYGGARPALFKVNFTAPPSLGFDQNSVEKASFVCRAAELPASTVGTVEIGYFGRKIKIAGDRTFADWTVTIMNDEDFAVRALFEAWMNAINRHVSNVRDANIGGENPAQGDTYKVDVTVEQYSKDGEMIRAYQLIGAFPTNVSAIALDWDNQNQIETFQTTFTYDYWVPVLESSSKIDGGQNPYLGQAQQDGISGPN
jgi:uncharacterized protein affecting Mg2+/Co2+ transport